MAGRAVKCPGLQHLDAARAWLREELRLGGPLVVQCANGTLVAVQRSFAGPTTAAALRADGGAATTTDEDAHAIDWAATELVVAARAAAR